MYTMYYLFCSENCSDLLWEINNSGSFWKFEAEGQEFAKLLKSLEQFIQTVKDQNNLFKLNIF